MTIYETPDIEVVQPGCTTFADLCDVDVTPIAEIRHLGIGRGVWEGWWVRRKAAFAEWMYTSTVMQLLCCTVSDEQKDMHMHDSRLRQIKLQSLVTYDYCGAETAIDAAISREAARGCNLSSRSESTIPLKKDSGFSASLVVAVVDEVRYRIGQCAENDANVKLVSSEANRLMRNYNVRSGDAGKHMPYILRTFFREDVHCRVATHEARMGRFQRWLNSRPRAKPSLDALA